MHRWLPVNALFLGFSSIGYGTFLRCLRKAIKTEWGAKRFSPSAGNDTQIKWINQNAEAVNRGFIVWSGNPAFENH
jgi:hypothetical protein